MIRLAAAAMLAAALAGCVTDGGEPPAAAAAVQGAPLDEEKARDLYLSLVSGMHRQGKHHAALAYLDDYDRRHAADARATLLRARLLTALGRHGEAEALYRGLLDGAYAAQAQDGIGRVAAKEGRWPDAVRAFRRAVALAPTQAGFVGNLGYGLLNLGTFEEAEFYLLQAAELAPDSRTVLVNLLLCQHALGKDAAVAAGLARVPVEAERRRIRRLLANWPSSDLPSPDEGGV